MPHDLSVSIILCTRNRAAELQQTLESLGTVGIRSDWKAEVIVVDNGSTDETAKVASQAKLGNMEVRYVHEARAGKARGLNAGLAQAREQRFNPLFGGSLEFVLTTEHTPVLEKQMEKLVTQLAEELERVGLRTLSDERISVSWR